MLCEKNTQTARCSCRNKNQCPLNGICEIESVMYNCDVQTESTPKTNYIGITEGSWKARRRTHKHSFIKERRKNDTDLSKYIWKAKPKNEDLQLNGQSSRKHQHILI